MNKKEIIQQLKIAHEGLREILATVSPEIADSALITPKGWTVKDILSHLIDWNVQFLQDFKNILSDSWEEINNDTFNQASYEKRKDLPYHQVYAEWELSIEPVIELLQSLTSEEWHHVCKGATWHNGTLVTIPSLFEYTYKGEPHELGHGKEIRKAL
ncbi:hypothetical protein A2690_01730 [Candidatus Roizmanbacteria bacterium RIFCSPHIGHO2_01_FULL_39_12b]|uniref:Uncharacterized protein n=1 Tax=Candidatus Roizmanbacteria bacterium RIFCSPHIGHO2_01_FULL_39_12b TaxID=1802030 RepID=A0A1F7GB61_9BACT|nr:MAG: hypothetical protein A2690_01730 [Candidatus Roizmanbacteria bacterium RIFCSPHIGHO2_01_FULL_39_12b]OGK46141.1 MAG: hypothetical protein A3B46_02975 [Candidatus Roizmanbacteria bacterium RIFCSPLOWO2_01_FULL_39_19]